MTTISQNFLKLIKNLVIITVIISFGVYGKELFQMKNPYGNKIELTLALSKVEHAQGLSGLKAGQFSSKKGMLFVNPEMGPRRFWMPDTHFNLDILFLDSDLKIVGIEKNVLAHPGLKEPPEIYKTGIYNAQYVLEIKAGSPFGSKLKINDKLKFSGPTSLSEIALSTRQKQ
ncbi:MAG: DUF192 domain-containing protein [Bacteriovorax sp.]|jgi:hypothetical protein